MGFSFLKNQSGQALIQVMMAVAVIGLLAAGASNFSARLDNSVQQMQFQMGMDGLASEVMNVASSDTQCGVDVVLPGGANFGLTIAADQTATLNTGVAAIPLQITLPFSTAATIPNTAGLPTTLKDLDLITNAVNFTPLPAAGKPTAVVLNSDGVTYTVSGYVTIAAMSARPGYVAAATRQMANLNFHVDNTGKILSCYTVASAQEVCTQLGGLWYPTLIPACRFAFNDMDCNPAAAGPATMYISGIDANANPICSPWIVKCPAPANAYNTCTGPTCTALVGIMGGLPICASPQPPAPLPQISWVVASESAQVDGGAISIMLTSDSALSAPVTVTITPSGNAVLGTDYSLPSTTATLPIGAGPTTAPFVVTVLNDGSTASLVANFTITTLSPATAATAGPQNINSLTLTPGKCTSVTPQTWLTNCTGAPTGTTAWGATQLLANTVATYTGTATYLCNSNNTWTLQGVPAPTCTSTAPPPPTGSCSGTPTTFSWSERGMPAGGTCNYTLNTWPTAFLGVTALNPPPADMTAFNTFISTYGPNVHLWCADPTICTSSGSSGTLSYNVVKIKDPDPTAPCSWNGNVSYCAAAPPPPPPTGPLCYMLTTDTINPHTQMDHYQYYYYTDMASCTSDQAVFTCNGTWSTALVGCTPVMATDANASSCSTAAGIGQTFCAIGTSGPQLCGTAMTSLATYHSAAAVTAAGPLCLNGSSPGTFNLPIGGNGLPQYTGITGTGPWGWYCWKGDSNGPYDIEESCEANGP